MDNSPRHSASLPDLTPQQDALLDGSDLPLWGGPLRQRQRDHHVIPPSAVLSSVPKALPINNRPAFLMSAFPFFSSPFLDNPRAMRHNGRQVFNPLEGFEKTKGPPMSTITVPAIPSATAFPATSPRTPDGKAVAARNATTHGLFARDIVLPALGEDPQGYKSLEAAWLAQLPPRTLLEQHYVEKIAAASWRLRRLHRWQAQLFEDDTLTRVMV